jgi:hypothetical protein
MGGNANNESMKVDAYELAKEDNWKSIDKAKQMVTSLTKEDLNKLREESKRTINLDKTIHNLHAFEKTPLDKLKTKKPIIYPIGKSQETETINISNSYENSPQKAKEALANLNKHILGTFERASLESLKGISPKTLDAARKVVSQNDAANKALISWEQKLGLSENVIKKDHPERYAIALVQSLMISCCSLDDTLKQFYNSSSDIDASYGVNTFTALKNALEENTRIYRFNGIIKEDVLRLLIAKLSS